MQIFDEIMNKVQTNTSKLLQTHIQKKDVITINPSVDSKVNITSLLQNTIVRERESVTKTTCSYALNSFSKSKCKVIYEKYRYILKISKHRDKTNCWQREAKYQEKTMTTDQCLAVRKNLDGRILLNCKTKNLSSEVIYLTKIEPVHHQKMKLKPPIPRMNSKTPPKFTQQRPKSPQTQKKLLGGQKVQAEKKQIFSQTKNANEVTENIASPRNITGRQFDDPSASNVSKGSSLKLGKPNIYIQKQAKLNTVSVSSPRQLDRSSLTEKPIGSGSSQVTQQNSEQKLAKSQLSINSDKNKVNSLEITN